MVSAEQWGGVKNIASTWSDLYITHSRVLRKLLWAIVHNDALLEHEQDCGFGLAVVFLVSLRAVDYDDGSAQARSDFHYLQGLLRRLEPHWQAGVAAGWDIDTTDLAIYPNLLSLEPKHRCYGSNLRIFLYNIIQDFHSGPSSNDGEMTRGVLHCQQGQWGLEALIPHWLRQGSCVTEDPQEADLFFVPWHTWCDRMVYRMNQTRGEISQVYIELMNRRSELLPHWSRNDGRDHVFLFSDQGMNFFPEYREYIPHSIFLVTEALTPECGPSCFNPWKDIVLPGHTDYFRYRRMRAFNLPSEERSVLFNFHGRHPSICHLYKDNVVRGKIMEVFTGKPRVSVGGFVEDYFEIMGKSHFCLIPMGTSSWTNHLYEAFYAGCIPVILSDDFQVPFDELIEWPSLSIKWPMADVSMELYRHLEATPLAEIRSMKAAVDAHACWFDYHQTLESPGEDCSPYLGLLKMLERRTAMLYKWPGRFWRHT